jgi:RHS repeat-associated protein
VESRSYDAAGRLTGRSWADGTSVTYGYDPVGRRTEMTDEHGVTRYGYDPVGNVVEVVGPDGQRVAYGYDAAGRRTSVTHPDGAMVTMAHDVAGRLSEVKHPLLGATALQWDADGRLVGETLPGGQMRGYAYDAAGRLAGFDQQVAGADRSTTVSRDAAGRITSETTGGVATSYRYDPAGQLLSSSSPSLSTSYAYDVLGRRTSASTNGVPITYSHDPAGQLVSEVVDGAERTYTYDESGRRTGAADSEVSTRYGYDARGLLEVIETTTADGTAVEERRYDGDGTLVEVVRIDPTGVTSSTGLVWDQARPVPEILAMDTDGSQATFAYGVGRIGVVEDGTTAAVFGIDVHGSAITTPATAGFVVAGAYDPFGNPIVDAPATVDCGDRPLHPLDPNHCAGDSAGGNPPDVGNGKGPTRADSTPTVLTTTELPSRPALGFGYRGELHSDDLVHLRARDYDPSTGAFTTRDPLDGVNGTTTVANPYHYAENDPLNRTDPSGLRPEDDDFDHESARSGGPMLHCGRFIGPCLPSSVARPRDVTTCPNRCWMSDRNLRFESSMFPDHRRWDGVLVISTQRLAQPPSSSSWYVPVFPIIDPRAAEYGWWSIGRDSDRQVDTGRGFLVTGSADTGTVLVQSVRYEAITDTSRIGIGTETNNPGPGIDLNTSRGTTYRVVEHLGYAEYFRETVYVFTRLGYGYVDDVL